MVRGCALAMKWKMGEIVIRVYLGGSKMRLTTVRELAYLRNDEEHTIRYSQICKDLAENAPYRLNAVATDTTEEAVTLLRYDIIKYLDEHFKEQSIKGKYSDFKFQIHYTDIKNCRVDLVTWLWDRQIYSLEGV